MNRFHWPHILKSALAFVLLAGLATSAYAVKFTVTLKNGTTFETRYRPMQADFDPSYSLLMTDKGNWIALHNDEIADIVSKWTGIPKVDVMHTIIYPVEGMSDLDN